MSCSRVDSATIKAGMDPFLGDHPRLKYVFFGGKGGVGKTVLAAAMGLWSARRGRRVLLASTNPVHSLSNLFNMDLFGAAQPVCDVANFHALEIDTRETIERSKREISQKLDWFLKYADIGHDAQDFVELATMNPAFEESAMFENMVDLIFKDEYDLYVFDTAPAANARRLISMSKVYGVWVEKMLKSRDEARSMQQALSFSKRDESDPLLEYLANLKERIGRVRELLTDEALAAFFFVTLPERLPIAVVSRFMDWFHEFGIPVGGVVVNGVIPRDEIEEDTARFVLHRVRMQERYLEEIRSAFGNEVRAVVPLLEGEVKGSEMLNRVADHLFGA